jgi:hypothetical protein
MAQLEPQVNLVAQVPLVYREAQAPQVYKVFMEAQVLLD